MILRLKINIDIDGDVVKLCMYDIVDVNNKNGYGYVYIIFGCFFRVVFV